MVRHGYCLRLIVSYIWYSPHIYSISRECRKRIELQFLCGTPVYCDNAGGTSTEPLGQPAFLSFILLITFNRVNSSLSFSSSSLVME